MTEPRTIGSPPDDGHVMSSLRDWHRYAYLLVELDKAAWRLKSLMMWADSVAGPDPQWRARLIGQLDEYERAIQTIQAIEWGPGHPPPTAPPAA